MSSWQRRSVGAELDSCGYYGLCTIRSVSAHVNHRLAFIHNLAPPPLLATEDINTRVGVIVRTESLLHLLLFSRPPPAPPSPSVVVPNQQQGVVGRGRRSRWACESPAGSDQKWDSSEDSLPVSFSQPEVMTQLQKSH